MELDQLHKKLVAIAQANPPGNGVPYAFEKRIMARLAAQAVVDVWTLYGRWLWRAVTPCFSVMAGLAIWVLVTMPSEPDTHNLEQALENTILSSDDVSGE
jgi:hypothetical protein